MSRKRDWDRVRQKEVQRALPVDRLYDGPVRVDPLESVILEAVEARRAGRFVVLPKSLSRKDAKTVWRAVFTRLAGQRIACPEPAAPKAEERAQALAAFTQCPDSILKCPPGPRRPEIHKIRAHPSKQGVRRKPTRRRSR